MRTDLDHQYILVMVAGVETDVLDIGRGETVAPFE